MTAINKIPRGLRVLIVMAILGVLVWRFAMGTAYYYYGLGVAVLITLGAIYFTYHTNRSGTTSEIEKNKSEKSEANLVAKASESQEADSVGINSRSPGEEVKLNSKSVSGSRSIDRLISFRTAPAPRPDAAKVTAQYYQMAKKNGDNEESSVISAAKPLPIIDEAVLSVKEVEETKAVNKPAPDTLASSPPIPLIEDESVLTEDDKNELVNAVWARCENPYCKFSRFLEVHHIMDEKNGGTNKLDNLIVLCPYCHDLAHKNEIPEDEMRDWISHRDETFKFKPDWRYN